MPTGDVDLDAREALTALERFVVENDALLALEERIGRFLLLRPSDDAFLRRQPGSLCAFSRIRWYVASSSWPWMVATPSFYRRDGDSPFAAAQQSRN